MKVDVYLKQAGAYLKQARRNVKRDSYPLPDEFSPHCLCKAEAVGIARLLIREGYPPPFVFETLQFLDVEPGHRIGTLVWRAALSRGLRPGQPDRTFSLLR